MFNFSQEMESAKAAAQSDKWDKARMYHNSVVFCLRNVEVIENPFKKTEKDAVNVYEFTLLFLHEGRKNSVTTTYRITPEIDWLLARHPMPWHCMQWRAYKTSAGGTGYELAQASMNDHECSCFGRKPAQAEVVAASLPGLPAPYDASTSEPITEKTQQALLKASTVMMSNFGVRVDPGNFEVMTEQQGKQLLDSFRAQWLAQSVAHAQTTIKE